MNAKICETSAHDTPLARPLALMPHCPFGSSPHSPFSPLATPLLRLPGEVFYVLRGHCQDARCCYLAVALVVIVVAVGPSVRVCKSV